MNFLENCLLLLGLPVGMVLTGYWLAARLTSVTASERIAVAVLAGLAALLLNIAAINFFEPLANVWAWACLWPVALTLLIPGSRRRLFRDVAEVGFRRRGMWAAALAAAFLVLILWPLLSQPTLVYYDGTSNHDAFFWIASAEHLKRHTYMELPVTSALHPLTNATPAIIGWRPQWGRMGAEGLLAFTSSIIGLAPVKLYLAATATLLIPWIAAVFLAVRTFLAGRLSTLATVALVGLQPVFVFYHGNANLPNFVGALMAAGTVIATERSLRPERNRGTWCVLLILSLHGLICSYPEMLPFVVMPAGLLWLRAWFAQGFRAAWKPATFSALAWIGGILINPASSVRAWWGFVFSFDTARANQNWANLFESLTWIEYFPAMATLSVGSSRALGQVLCALLTVALVAAIVLALRKAVDRLGALFTLAGAAALLIYTLYTGFNYGWQKTVQFGGAFWAALLPVAAIEALVSCAPVSRRARWAVRAALVGIVGFFSLATIYNCLDGHKWSRRKILTQDWFSLRDYSRDHLSGAPVLVDGATFPMSFFHGMWAAYFLPESELYFAARGHENGGYLRNSVINEGNHPIPKPAAYLVSREWADTFDANSERLMLGDTVALLKTANRVFNWEGLNPESGHPDNADGVIKIQIQPHAPSTFSFTLSPRSSEAAAGAVWKIRRHIEGRPDLVSEVSGAPPWLVSVPLERGLKNEIELVVDPKPAAESVLPFTVHDILIKTRVE